METVDTTRGWAEWKVLAKTTRAQLAVMTIEPGRERLATYDLYAPPAC